MPIMVPQNTSFQTSKLKGLFECILWPDRFSVDPEGSIHSVGFLNSDPVLVRVSKSKF